MGNALTINSLVRAYTKTSTTWFGKEIKHDNALDSVADYDKGWSAAIAGFLTFFSLGTSWMKFNSDHKELSHAKRCDFLVLASQKFPYIEDNKIEFKNDVYHFIFTEDRINQYETRVTITDVYAKVKFTIPENLTLIEIQRISQEAVSQSGEIFFIFPKKEEGDQAQEIAEPSNSDSDDTTHQLDQRASGTRTPHSPHPELELDGTVKLTSKNISDLTSVMRHFEQDQQRARLNLNTPTSSNLKIGDSGLEKDDLTNLYEDLKTTLNSCALDEFKDNAIIQRFPDAKTPKTMLTVKLTDGMKTYRLTAAEGDKTNIEAVTYEDDDPVFTKITVSNLSFSKILGKQEQT